MKPAYKVAIGAAAVLLGSALVATRPAGDREESRPVRAQLAEVMPAARHDIDYAQIDARLNRLMERPTMVGLAVGIVENGRITFLKGYGETLANSDDPVTEQTVFRWASLSKGVAGTMVAKLAAEGRIDLSAPVARYSETLKLPDNAEHRATVGDLLSHRLGIYRNAYDNKLEDGQDPAALRTQLAKLDLICQPGTCWSYGNVSFDAATEIVQRETGRPFREALQRRLFEPLGLTSASITRDGLMNSASWARPHNSGRREVELTEPYYKVPSAGGVNSDIKDLTLWMLAQMGQTPDVISPNVLQAIHAPLVETPTERRRLRKFLERLGKAWYGYGWRSYDYSGHRVVGHRGGLNGYRSLILFDPHKKSGVVALWNSNTSQPNGLQFEVMDMVYDLPFRDWMQVERSESPTETAAEDEETSDTGGGAS